MTNWYAIFEAGKQTDSAGNERIWTETDLDTMVTKYNGQTAHTAPCVLGHPKSDDPAYGWVESLKREGKLLYAKYKDVQPEFVDWVNRKLYQFVSIALYPDLTLRHVGFLGASPPAVKNLPAHAFLEEIEENIIYCKFAEVDETEIENMPTEFKDGNFQINIRKSDNNNIYLTIRNGSSDGMYENKDAQLPEGVRYISENNELEIDVTGKSTPEIQQLIVLEINNWNNKSKLFKEKSIIINTKTDNKQTINNPMEKNMDDKAIQTLLQWSEKNLSTELQSDFMKIVKGVAKKEVSQFADNPEFIAMQKRIVEVEKQNQEHEFNELITEFKEAKKFYPSMKIPLKELFKMVSTQEIEFTEEGNSVKSSGKDLLKRVVNALPAIVFNELALREENDKTTVENTEIESMTKEFNEARGLK